MPISQSVSRQQFISYEGEGEVREIARMIERVRVRLTMERIEF